MQPITDFFTTADKLVNEHRLPVLRILELFPKSPVLKVPWKGTASYECGYRVDETAVVKETVVIERKEDLPLRPPFPPGFSHHLRAASVQQPAPEKVAPPTPWNG